MKRKNRIVGVFLGIMIGCVALAGCGEQEKAVENPVLNETIVEEATGENTQIFGKIAAINVNDITVTVAERPGMPQGEKPDGEKPDGEKPDGEKPDGEKADGEKPDGEKPDGEKADGERPEMPDSEMPDSEMPEGGGLSGEERTVTVSADTVYQADGKEASLEDIKVDDMVTILLNGEEVISISVMSQGEMPQGEKPQGGMSKEKPEGEPGGKIEAGGDSAALEIEGVNVISDQQSWSDAVYESTEEDVSAIVVAEGGELTLSNAEIVKSGDTGNTENSEFYGLNAALLARADGSIQIKDSTITTEAEGANAVFATGENTKIEIENVKISTSGNSARGLDATYGGSITADTVEIATKGAHCAALATDRGEGSVTVTNGSLSTEGEGSPCIYSTGEISVTDSKGMATGSALAVVEGKNSINVINSELEGYGIGRANGGIDDAGIMLYQSMSGDAGEGTGIFSAVDSKLSISQESEKYMSAPMFFVTNTDAVINLKQTELSYGSGLLLYAAGNEGEWGKQGENGGNVELNAENQELKGDVTLDQISSVVLNLKNSTLEGSINAENTGDVTLMLDENSSFTASGDSYLAVLTNEDETCSNILSNGYTIYYNAENSANSWLNNRTMSLQGGGVLKPME